MCGISAAFAFNYHGTDTKDRDIFFNLWYANVVRGPHSCGLFYVTDQHSGLVANSSKQDPYSYWFKGIGHPLDLELHDTWETKIDGELKKSRFIVGHNRWATKGKVTTANAHPFQAEDITMVHNGTINYIEGMKDFHKFDVDSEALANDLMARDHLTVLRSIRGAAAMIWYDNRDNKMRLFRNEERPLWMCKTSKKKLYIASEQMMLNWICARNHVEGQIEIKQLPVGEVWEFSHDSDEPVITKVIPSRKEWKQRKNGCWEYVDNSQEAIEEARAALAVAFTSVAATPVTPTVVNSEKSQSPKEEEKKIIADSTTGSAIKLIPIKDYFGISREDYIIFSPENLETVDKRTSLLYGKFKNIVTPSTAVNYGMLSDLEIVSRIVKGNKYTADTLFESKFICGRIVSLLVREDDVSWIKCHVTDIEPMTQEEYDKVLKLHISKTVGSYTRGMH